MSYDPEHIRYLRREAEINHIDTGRARLKHDGAGGLVVELDPPLFDLGTLLEEVPTTISARSAAEAEWLMLTWQSRVQRAERQRARMGHTCGWTTEEICRRPLSAIEVDAHLERVKRAKESIRLQEQLIKKLESAKVEAAKVATDELTERYGVPDKHSTNAVPPALNVPTKRTVRKS